VEARDAAYEFADSFHSKANSDHAVRKATSFGHYAKQLIVMQKGQSNGDSKLLNRPKDGLIYYFGKHDVSKITTGMVRDYLFHLDENRPKLLAGSTKAKHTIIIRKILTLAVEDGILNIVPVMPKQKTVDTPRHTFTDREYKLFMTTALACSKCSAPRNSDRLKLEFSVKLPWLGEELRTMKTSRFSSAPPPGQFSMTFNTHLPYRRFQALIRT
jgi:hypothetical protein